MKQIVVNDYPPVYAECVRAFDLKPDQPVLFAWGETIYNPTGCTITPELFAHEAVHGARQMEQGVEAWWKSYLADARFRVFEESLAHVAEYAAYVRRHANRRKRTAMLEAIAQRLCGPLYGNLLTFNQAVQIVRAA